jgi:hypothetical protein
MFNWFFFTPIYTTTLKAVYHDTKNHDIGHGFIWVDQMICLPSVSG